MNEIKIENGNIKNLSEIQKLNQLLFVKEQKEFDPKYDTNWPYKPEGIAYFTRLLNKENGVVFVAQIDEKIVGYLAASVSHDTKYIDDLKIAELDNMFVLEEYRHQKIGTQLVEEFKKWANDMEASRLVVTASFGNDMGIEFYKKQGFKDFDLGFRIDL